MSMLAAHQITSTHPITNLIIAGASITNSPWFTWADFLIESINLPALDLSARGASNEYIVASIVQNFDNINKN